MTIANHFSFFCLSGQCGFGVVGSGVCHTNAKAVPRAGSIIGFLVKGEGFF